MIDEKLLKQNVLEILGVDKLPKARQTQLLSEIIVILQDRMILRVVQSIPEEKRDEFYALVDTADDDKITKFIEQYIDNLEELIKEEAVKLKEELKEVSE